MRFQYLFVLASLLVSPVVAAELPAPSGDVILTVEGKLDSTNADGKAQFDLAMLDALPQRVTTASTPWYTGEQSFSGVVVSDLLSFIGASGETATVTALNDYSAEIPVSDFEEMPVILATRVNGEPLSVRDKGPIFVIYPFDLDGTLYNEVIFSRSVWQVASIQVH